MIKYIIKTQNEIIHLFQINNRQLRIPNTEIPKTIIHTWNTKNIENTDLYYQVNVVKNLHPDFNYVFFDEDDRQKFIKENYSEKIYKAYLKLKPMAYRADLWRYCYLYKFGGFYIDFKFIMRKSFNSIIKENTKILVGKAMYSDGINQGFIACLPNEPLIKLAIDTAVERIETEYYGKSSLDITGPLMFEDCFNKLYNINSSDYINNQKPDILMGLYNDINNYNCILFNNNILAHNGFSTYYTKHRTSPYINFWNTKNVYNKD
jgi:mannosyltransferase OCH1-like enzyme